MNKSQPTGLRWAWNMLSMRPEVCHVGRRHKALVRRVLAEVRDGWTQAVIDQFFAPD